MKYKLTTNTIVHNGITLYQIEALKSFSDVTKGDKGGYIQSEDNLSQDGNAWVWGDAWVSGNAWVSGDAWVFGNAKVSGDAWVFGNAKVYEDTWVFGNAEVWGNAEVYEDTWVFGMGIKANSNDADAKVWWGNNATEVYKVEKETFTVTLEWTQGDNLYHNDLSNIACSDEIPAIVSAGIQLVKAQRGVVSQFYIIPNK